MRPRQIEEVELHDFDRALSGSAPFMSCMPESEDIERGLVSTKACTMQH